MNQPPEKWLIFLCISLFGAKFITNTPNGANAPFIVLIELFTDSFYMHIHGAGISAYS